MAKFQSPLLGYNNNVRHKGRVFHIQTEDSGVNHPHIITHLFMDGGRILKSVKRSYAEHVGSEKMSDLVRGLMKEQHKAMFIALRDGKFDELLDSTSSMRMPASAERSEPALVAVTVAASTPAASQPRSSTELAPPTIDESQRREITLSSPGNELNRNEPAAAIRAAQESVTSELDPDTTPEDRDVRPPPASPSRELTLDFEPLEPDAHDNGLPSLFRSIDLPPPPKNLFTREPGSGAYSAIEGETRFEQDSGVTPASRPHPIPGGRVPPHSGTRGGTGTTQRSAGRAPPNEGRYAPARPAAIFGVAAKQTTTSIFGDEVVGDKTLDEVILSYLAEDLEPPRRK
jgi:hypothetical protein